MSPVSRDARARLLDRLVARVEDELAAIDRALAPDVYAIQLWLPMQDDLEPPHLLLGWNTGERFAQVDAKAKGRLRLNSRWNSGTWINHGREIDDPGSRALAAEALIACGLDGSSHEDLFSDPAGELRVEIKVAAARFIAALARALHDRGVLERALGHPVLVVCHTGSDSEPWTRLTLDANPPSLYGDFLDFHEQEGVHDERF